MKRTLCGWSAGVSLLIAYGLAGGMECSTTPGHSWHGCSAAVLCPAVWHGCLGRRPTGFPAQAETTTEETMKRR